MAKKDTDCADYIKTLTEEEAAAQTNKDIFYCMDNKIDFLKDMDERDIKDLIFDIFSEMRKREINSSEFMSSEEHLYDIVSGGGVAERIVIEGTKKKLADFNDNFAIALKVDQLSVNNNKRTLPANANPTEDKVLNATEVADPIIATIKSGGELKLLKALYEYGSKLNKLAKSTQPNNLIEITRERKKMPDILKAAVKEVQADLTSDRDALREERRAASKKIRDRGTLPGDGGFPG